MPPPTKTGRRPGTRVNPLPKGPKDPPRPWLQVTEQMGSLPTTSYNKAIVPSCGLHSWMLKGRRKTDPRHLRSRLHMDELSGLSIGCHLWGRQD